MATTNRERVSYFNGRIVPESQAVVSFRDRSFRYGDGAFDMTRTFGHKIFKLKEHVDRFYNTLRYFQMDPGMTRRQMIDRSMEVLETNLPLIDKTDDYWVGQRVSSGTEVVEADMSQHSGATVIIECTPLPLQARASLFKDGIDVIVPSVRRTPPESLSPRAKSHNYLNLIMGELEAKSYNPMAWAVLLDIHGNFAEGMGSNFFTVKDGIIRTPRPRFVLCGISRQTVIDLAGDLGIPVLEEDIDPFDAYVADEVFLTSTSLCICGVATVNGNKIADGSTTGPITKALTTAYVDLVDFDWVSQYTSRLEA